MPADYTQNLRRGFITPVMTTTFAGQERFESTDQRLRSQKTLAGPITTALYKNKRKCETPVGILHLRFL